MEAKILSAGFVQVKVRPDWFQLSIKLFIASREPLINA
jgi:hypothetical protein